MDNDLFDDLITACNEIREYQKGNLQLRKTTYTDDDMDNLFIERYKNLPDDMKKKARDYIVKLSSKIAV